MIRDTFFFEVILVERIELAAMHSRPDGKGSHVFDFVVGEIVEEMLVDASAVEVVGRNGEIGGNEEILELVGGHCCLRAHPEEGESVDRFEHKSGAN